MAKEKKPIITILKYGAPCKMEVLQEHPNFIECKGENGTIELIAHHQVIKEKSLEGKNTNNKKK